MTDYTENNSSQEWTLLQKVLFRIAFIYIMMFVAFQNNGAFPEWGHIIEIPMDMMNAICRWVGKTFFGINEISTAITGSGDTTNDWLILLVCISTALLGSVIWSLLDRDRKNYQKLFYWLTLVVRFYVGLMLINYGFYKLFKTQFSYPGTGRLVQPYGDSSPMGLAWTFLGYSYGYNIFMGVAEVAGGLLLFRRTLSVGAIISLMTSANVMAMNYFFDIPVKITSTHLVLFCLFLLLPNMKQLIGYFFLGKSSKLKNIPKPEFKNTTVGLVLNVLKYLLILYSLYLATETNIYYMKQRTAPKEEYIAEYTVNDFNINGKEYTHFRDSVRWKTLRISQYGIGIQKQNKVWDFYRYEHNDENTSFNLLNPKDSTAVGVLDYNIDSTFCYFQWIDNSDTIRALTDRRTAKDFVLTSRKFHWVSERPYQR